MTRTIEKTRYGTLPSTISLKIREPGSALTHFAALVLLTAGSGPLMIHAKESGSRLTMVGAAIFLMTSCLLYAASTCYHTVVLDERRTTIFRKMDHISIAIMIAGSYTPICLSFLKNVPLLVAVWVLAVFSALLKLFWITCPKWLSSVLYLLMGWLCVFSFKSLLLLLPAPAFGLLACCWRAAWPIPSARSFTHCTRRPLTRSISTSVRTRSFMYSSCSARSATTNSCCTTCKSFL